MRLILIRHAETDGNKTHYVGREDLPLNETGREQTDRLAEALAGHRIDAVLSSPLSRAVSTALAVARDRDLAVEIRSELIEIDFGELQGMPKGERPFKLRKAHRDTPLPGGESLRDVWQRLDMVRSEISDLLTAGVRVAAVGHYWSNRLLLAQLAGLPFADALGKGGYRPANASAYALDFTVASGRLHLEGTTQLFSPPGSE